MDLKKKLKENGWGKMKPGSYPRPYLWEWLEANRPEVLKAYAEWFDREVREK